jgi:hypothetical protein
MRKMTRVIHDLEPRAWYQRRYLAAERGGP